MTTIFDDLPNVRYAGPDTDDPLAFRWYDKERLVLGRSMGDWLRFSACYWHSFNWPGSDVFGAGTLPRPWLSSGSPIAQAEAKMDAAFVFFERLGIPFFTFHDIDVAPEGIAWEGTHANLERMASRLAEKMGQTKVGLLWGTANLFFHPRYAAGAATNPDPDVFACAAHQVAHCLSITHQLGGANYVLWGGREGYETLLNTDLKREQDQLGRFMSLVADHKHKIGFKGQLLIEPKPHEPTKHQYDFDAQSVHAFLLKYGLEREFKLNIEANHATLAGHGYPHELAYAATNGLLGSVDANRGDPQNGWDTDQFPNDPLETLLSMYVVVRAGGLGAGGFNFDAKLRRQSVDPVDLLHAHVGGMDTIARGLLGAAQLFENGGLQAFVDARYVGWEGPEGRAILAGDRSLADLAGRVLERNPQPIPRSGGQERLENLVNRFV